MCSLSRIAAVFALLVACSDTTSSSPAVSSGSGGQGQGAGGHPSGGSGGEAGHTGPAACPAEPPSVGSPCSTAGLLCEYRVTEGALECRSLLGCAPSGEWDSAGFGSCSDPNACPKERAGLETAQCMPSDRGPCVYGEEVCTCDTESCGGTPPPVGGSGQGGPPTWSCAPIPAGDCPVLRPLFGEACAHEALACDYTRCCGSGEHMVCTGGIWRGTVQDAQCG